MLDAFPIESPRPLSGRSRLSLVVRQNSTKPKVKAIHDSSRAGSWLSGSVLAAPSNSPGPPSKGLPPPAPSNVVDCPSGPVAASAF
jgi:hypothetical protein